MRVAWQRLFTVVVALMMSVLGFAVHPLGLLRRRVIASLVTIGMA